MNGNGHEKGKGKRPSRLDRIEAALELMIRDHEEFRLDHKQLLTAQVLLTDAQAKLTEAQRKSEEKIEKLAAKVDALTDAQQQNAAEIREINQRTDERIAALVSAIGELIRRMPLPPQA